MKTRSVTFWTLLCLAGSPLLSWGSDKQNPSTTSLPAATNSSGSERSPAPPASSDSGVLVEVTKMVANRTDPAVIKSFIQAWETPYSLSADEILHLHDLGAPIEVLTALISRSAQLHAQTMPMPSPTTEMPDLLGTNPPAVLYPYPGPANSATASAPYPAALYSYPDYSFSYLYPYSSYPGYYGYSPFWSAPYLYPWPYYRYYSPLFYPRRFGYPGTRYGYRYYPSRPYGLGRSGLGRPGPGWHGRW